MMAITSNSKYTSLAWQVFLNGICEASVFVPTQVCSLIEVLSHNYDAKSKACMTVALIMGVFQGYNFYISFTKFGEVDMNRSKLRTVGDVANIP